MRNIFFLFLLSVIPFFAQAQQQKPNPSPLPQLDSAYTAIDRRDDSIPKNAYIDSFFCAQYGFRKVSMGNYRMFVWQNIDKPKENDFIRLCDIRWKFKNHQEALAFHRKYLNVNAENGNQIANYNFTIPGAEELKVFRESDAITEMVKKQNMTLTFYYYIFVMDNYVVKVFVNGKQNLTVNDAAVFPLQAAKRMAALSRFK